MSLYHCQSWAQLCPIGVNPLETRDLCLCFMSGHEMDSHSKLVPNICLITAPKLAKGVKQKDQTIGSNFQVFCTVETGSLPVFYEWLRNGQTLKTSPEVNYKIENFEIKVVPKLGSIVSHKSLLIGSRFQVFCTVESGSAPVRFEWSRNGRTLNPSPESNYKIENFDMFSIFTIKAIDTRDAANYSCLATNAIGSDTQFVLLSIKVPKLGSIVSHKSLSIGSSFHVFCSIDSGSVPVFFEWTRNGQSLKTSPEVNYKIENFKMHSTFIIESIDRRDAGNYTCLVKNAFGTPKLLKLYNRSQTIGSIFHVSCSIEEGSLPVFFEWTRNGQSLKPSPGVNYKIDNFEMSSTFTIKSIERRDAGNYSCLVNNGFGSDGQSLSIGSHFQVFCTVEIGSLPVFFEWSRNGRTLKPSPGVDYKIDNFDKFSTFSISKIERRDAGNYSCFVSNAFGSDTQNVLLTIKGPKLAPVLRSKNQSQNSILQIFCTVESGSQPLTYEWHKNGQLLANSANNSSHYKIDNFHTFSTLTVQSVGRRDAGNYSCFVSNRFGTDSQIVLLTVEVPKLSAFMFERSITEKSYFQQMCAAEEGSMPFQFKWLFNGQSLPMAADSHRRIDMQNRSSTLAIDGVHKRDSGNYKCLVSNGFGTDSQSILLTVKVPKLKPHLPYNSQTEGSYYQQFCSVKKGSQPFFFEWSRNGQTLRSGPEVNYKIDNFDRFSTLTIASLVSSDAANYSCLVRNNLGSDSQYVVLTVEVYFVL
ncbi:unnamed protein product [Medioppia subpectinata]|uniref:Ig-like domain-containing protein n=1 Tax=Medioppia subpectinata TaxID=1979941 RepID=A0A7R9KGV3_9ACAR|nr:unnamed protein product [Medioppia subpectinata]CAG2103309.1 unnamed protein product [Medioppia subpectinata]